MPKKPPTLDHTHAVVQAAETLLQALRGLAAYVQDAVNETPRTPPRRRKSRPSPRRRRR